MKVTKPELIVIPLLTLLAFGLRVFQLGGPSLWYDELLELDIVQGSFWDIGPQLVRHAAMPLDYFLLYGWIQLGRQEAWIRFPALLFGTLTIPLIYKLASACFNKRVGYLAALWLALASIAVYYSQDARPYAMLMFWVLLSFWGLWRAYQTGWSRYWSVTMVGLTGAALSHYFTLFLLLPLGLFVGVQLLSHLKDKSYWQHAIFFMICLMVLVAVFAFNGRLGTLYSVGDRFSKVVTQPETLTLPSYLKPNRGVGPPRHLGFVLTGVLIPLGTSNPISLLVLNSGLIIAFFSFLKFKERRAVALLFGWLVLPIVLIYLFLLQRGTFFAARYILYALPAYLILCAYGVEALIQFLTRRSRYIMGWASRKVLAGSLVVIVITILGFG
jgi:4-amino-4-deoxy-L-arabinose transferase-like glycosyltransferase